MGCVSSTEARENIHLPYTTATWTSSLSFNQRNLVLSLIGCLKYHLRLLASEQPANEHTEELLALYGTLLNHLDDRTVLLNRSINKTSSFSESQPFNPGPMYPTLDLPPPPSH